MLIYFWRLIIVFLIVRMNTDECFEWKEQFFDSSNELDAAQFDV